MNPWIDFFQPLVMSPRPSSEGPMARFMRIEHRKDYDNAKSGRGYVSEEYAREFINKIHL